MTSPGLVYVDETVDEYRDLRLPKNWSIHYEEQWGSLQASLQWTLREYPDATQYGWLADDTYPRTTGWDKLLEQAAGEWCLSYANDLWFADGDITRYELEIGDNLSSGLCWGGELVRTVGWWALPGVRQAGIDTAWTSIVGPLGLNRYEHDIVVEHKNYKTGKREMDAVDDWTRDGANYIDNDIQVRNDWAASKDYVKTIARVSKAANVELTEPQRVRFRRKMRDQRISQLWNITMSGARLTRIMEQIDAEPDANFEHPFAVDPDPDMEQAG